MDGVDYLKWRIDNMLIKLKKILNTYQDDELALIDLWVDYNLCIEAIIVDENNIHLITEKAEIKINGRIEKEGKK